MMTAEQIRRALETKLSVPLAVAGRALGLGRRATKNAGRNGDIPVNRAGGKETVPSAWVKAQLRRGQEGF